jgi:hypothetical protein
METIKKVLGKINTQRCSVILITIMNMHVRSLLIKVKFVNLKGQCQLQCIARSNNAQTITLAE